MEKITIEAAEYGFKVSQGDKYAEVGFDEMLGLVAALTMPEKRPCVHWMNTDQERQALIDAHPKHVLRMAESPITEFPFEEAQFPFEEAQEAFYKIATTTCRWCGTLQPKCDICISCNKRV